MKEFYRHTKSGKIYEKTGTCINCTNAQDGMLMVCYSKGGLDFVRERSEFYRKFDEVDEI